MSKKVRIVALVFNLSIWMLTTFIFVNVSQTPQEQSYRRLVRNATKLSGEDEIKLKNDGYAKIRGEMPGIGPAVFVKDLATGWSKVLYRNERGLTSDGEAVEGYGVYMPVKILLALISVFSCIVILVPKTKHLNTIQGKG